MRTFTVSFFGHRQIEAPFQVESQLEKLISQLLQQNEFVEFLVGREACILDHTQVQKEHS